MIKRSISMILILSILFMSFGSTLAEMIRLPIALKTICAETFMNDTSIETVDLPWGITKIDTRAFANSTIKTIFIPDTVTSIANTAFDGTSVTLCSSSEAYAKTFADEHGLRWENCGSHYLSKVYEPALELANSDFRLDELQTSYVSLLSADGISDEAELDFINGLNALITEGNDAVDVYNIYVQGAYDGIESLVDSLSTVEVTENNGDVTFSLGGLNLVMDSSLASGKSSGIEVSETSISENGDMLTVNANGENYYITTSGNNVSITRSVQKAQSQAVFISKAANSALALYERLLNLIEEGYDLVMGMIADCANETAKLLESSFRALEYCQEKLPTLKESRRAFYTRKVTEFNNKIAELTAKQNSIARWSAVLAPLKIGAQITNGRRILSRWKEINAIYDHGHPTTTDMEYPQSIDLSEQLKKDIQSLWILYGTNSLNTLLGLAASIATIANGVMTFITPPSHVKAFFGFMTGGTFIYAIASVALSEGLSAMENNYYNAVIDADERLHTMIYGIVSDADTKNALENAYVTDGIVTTQTDDKGRYRLYVSPGTKDLTCRLKNYTAPDNLFAIVIKGDAVERNIEMKSNNATVHGVVKDVQTNALLSEVYVTAGNQTVVTGADGQFRLSLPAGSYSIKFSHSKYKDDEVPVTLQEKQDLELNWALQSGTLIMNRKDLEAIANDTSATYRLGANIDLSDAPWAPLPFFSGTLIGDGYSISGMNITDDTYGDLGLFAGLNGGAIKNVSLSGTIKLKANNDFIHAGLFAGNSISGKMDGCYASGSIDLGNGACSDIVFVGGMIAIGSIKMTDCSSFVGIATDLATSTFAGGLIGRLNAGLLTGCYYDGRISVRQSGQNNSEYMAFGNGYSDSIQSRRCYAFGTIEMTTNNGTAHAGGLSGADGGGCDMNITVRTDTGSAMAFGCEQGTHLTVSGNLRAIAQTSGSSYAAGIIGVQGTSYGCNNRSSVYAECASGQSLAVGMNNCIKGKNQGKVTSVCGNGNAIGQGMTNCRFSVNYADVTVTYKGIDDVSGGLSAHGLSNCTVSTNYGDVIGITKATRTSPTATGAAGGSYNINHARVESRSETGPVNARGVTGSYSQNHGAIFAQSTSLASQGETMVDDSATACGVGNNCIQSLNTGNVTAISYSSGAWAYGYGSGCSSSVSTGNVMAVTNYLQIVHKGTRTGYLFGKPYALNSTYAQASTPGITALSTGGSTVRIYYLVPRMSCEKHSGNAKYVTVENNQTSVDSCHLDCGYALSTAESQYQYPEMPVAPEEQ